MNRRALLSSIAAAAAAGCVGAPAEDSDDPAAGAESPTETDGTDGGTDESPTRSGEPTGTDSDPADGTETPTLEVSDVGVPPSETDGPDLGEDVVRVVPYPVIEPEDAPLSLSPSTDEASLPTAEIEFALANASGVTFQTNFYDWRLWKRVDGEWYRVAPWAVPEPLMMLPSGERHAWTLAVDNGRADDEATPSSTDRIEIGGLGGGEYAFSTDGWFSGGGHEAKVGLTARFRLNGDPVELTPEEGVEATRDGETVVATTDAEATEHTYPAAFVVERSNAESADDLVRYITEQLLRPRGFGAVAPLRNALPFFEEGVETVRLEAQTGSRPPFGVRDPYHLEYGGETYRVSVEKRESEAN